MDAAGGLNLGLVVGRLARDGGTEGQAWALAGCLAGRGHRVTVYCGEASDPPPGVAVRAVLPRRSEWRLARAVARLLLAEHDLVQTFLRVPGGAVHRAGGGAHRVWLRARGGWPRPADLLVLRAERRAVQAARVVVCNSEQAALDLRVAHGLSAARVRVVRNGVDLDRFRPDPARRAAARAAWGVPAGGRVALFVGSGFRRKGLVVAAAAFARVATATDRLVVLGTDAHATRWLQTARAHAGGRILTLGRRPDPERWIPGADAVILPTLYDPSANSTIEALACGIPAITSGRDGAGEIVPDRALVVSDPLDVAGFARALVRAWACPSPDPWRKAAAGWPVSRMADAAEAIYRELLNG